MKLLIKHEKLFWCCWCCGSGFHNRITVGSTVFSHNDQFGGALNDNEIDCGHDADAFIAGILTSVKFARIDYDYEEDFEDYRNDWRDDWRDD